MEKKKKQASQTGEKKNESKNIRKFLTIHETFRLNARILLRFTGIITIILILIFAFIYFRSPNIPENKSNGVLIKIPRGASFEAVADTLTQKGLLQHRNLFILFGKITGLDGQIRAGLFKIPKDLNAWQLLQYLKSAPSVFVKVTIPEGILSYQVAAILQEKVGIDSARFVNLVYDSNFTHQLGVSAPNLEGYLLPETYYFYWKIPEKNIIRYMVQNTLEIFKPDSVRNQLQKLNMSVQEIMTLASIIEGEAMIDSERVLISSVYHNRLKRNWRLQADPTIQFILPGPPRRLSYKDLEIDSPYNTYRYSGLPPGPINNPGKKSILAALFPADTKYLYFVATGDGGHHFSKTAAEHARWKQKLNKIRRQVQLEKRRQKLKGN